MNSPTGVVMQVLSVLKYIKIMAFFQAESDFGSLQISLLSGMCWWWSLQSACRLIWSLRLTVLNPWKQQTSRLIQTQKQAEVEQLQGESNVELKRAGWACPFITCQGTWRSLCLALWLVRRDVALQRPKHYTGSQPGRGGAVGQSKVDTGSSMEWLGSVSIEQPECRRAVQLVCSAVQWKKC